MIIPPCCCACPSTSAPGYNNITKVEDYELDGSGNPVATGGIAPYPRQPESAPSGPGCPDAPVCTHGSPSANKACGPWRKFPNSTQKPDEVLTGGVAGTGFNEYEVSGGTVSASRSCVGGHKVLQGVKMWPGRYGFTS